MSSDPKIIREIEASSKLLNFELKDISKELHGLLQTSLKLGTNLKKAASYSKEFDDYLATALPMMTEMEKNSSKMLTHQMELHAVNQDLVDNFTEMKTLEEEMIRRKLEDVKLEGLITEKMNDKKIVNEAIREQDLKKLKASRESLKIDALAAELDAKKINYQQEAERLGKKLFETRIEMSKVYDSDMDRRDKEIGQMELIDHIGGSLLSKFKKSSISKLLGIEKAHGQLSGMNKMALAVFFKLIETAFNNFLKFDKAASETRKKFGLLRGEADAFEKNIRNIGIEMMHLGVSFEDVAKATESIGFMFTTLVADNKVLIEGMSLVSAQLGIASDESAKFLKTMSSVGKSTVNSQVSMLGFAHEMSKAAGIPLASIMKDIASATDDVRIFTKLIGNNLINAAVQARAMGTSLDKMAKTGKSLLDFQTSITDEMEASVLLGKNVNFQNARNLAYQGKLVEASQEITKIANKLDFTAMDPFQAEAFAKASGKSVQELQEMMQIEQERNWIMMNGTAAQRQQLQNFEEMKKLNQSSEKSLGEQAMARLKDQANQERMVALTNQWNSLLSKISSGVMPLIDIALAGLTKGLEFLNNGGAGVAAVFASLGAGFSFVVSKVKVIGDFIGSIGSKFKWVGKILSVGKFFAKWLGPIGLVVNAFTFVSSLMKRWNEFPGGFMNGLKAIGYALKDTFIQPFIDIWDWLNEKFIGHSPSLLGEGILRGITSIGPMLLSALIMPFKTGFEIVSKLFSVTGLSDGMTIDATINKSSDREKNKDKDTITDIIASNREVSAKLTTLIDLMKSGGIAVNIDGSKASYLLAKAKAERGSFGTI